MPVSLQFSNLPVERNVYGRSASSAHYLNGKPASHADELRARQQQETPVATGYNWKSQPVGGRPGSATCAPAQTYESDPASASMEMSGQATQGDHLMRRKARQQTGAGAALPGQGPMNGFPGFKPEPEAPEGKRILGGSVPAGSTTVQSVVFGRDGNVAVASDVSRLPQFTGAAGIPNGAAGNGSQGMQQRTPPRPASFASGAGVQTVEHAYHATPLQDGGPKGRRSVGDRREQPAAALYAGAAGLNVGTPSALPSNADGELSLGGRRVNRPVDTMLDDLAATKAAPVGHAQMRHLPGPSGPMSLRGPVVTSQQPGLRRPYK